MASKVVASEHVLNKTRSKPKENGLQKKRAFKNENKM